jgi:uncharacterized membrane protein
MGGVSDAPKSAARLDSLDLLRGVVMALMALDHSRDYLTNYRLDPLDLEHTTPALFLTRWVTHFCAPVFVFLAGTSAFLYRARGKTRRETAWFLLTRGLWLVVLELTLVKWGWEFNCDYTHAGGAVIWAIGWSMVVLAGLVFLPTWLVAAFGVAVIALHNLTDGIPASDLGPLGALWAIVHSGEPQRPVWWFEFAIPYPVGPWCGVMAAGYGFGTLLLQERQQRRSALVRLGLLLIATFVVLRGLNFYGNPRPWAWQNSPLDTLFAFIDCNKYPPSLLYLLMTLGPAILALGLFDRPAGAIGRVFVTFGRVPLFFYLLHIPLIHAVAVTLDYIRFGWSPFAHRAFYEVPPDQLPPGHGFDLPVVYLLWMSVLATLYPLCQWYAGVKRRHPGGWLSYL